MHTKPLSPTVKAIDANAAQAADLTKEILSIFKGKGAIEASIVMSALLTTYAFIAETFPEIQTAAAYQSQAFATLIAELAAQTTQNPSGKVH
jgi:hypothetical protein